MVIFDFLFGSSSSDDSDSSDSETGKTLSSYPHEGSTAPEKHIDTYAYKGDDRVKENETRHITDKGHVNWGQKTKEFDEKNKKK